MEYSVVYLGLNGPLACAQPGRVLYGTDETLARVEAGTAGRVQVRDSDTEPWRDAPIREAVGCRG